MDDNNTQSDSAYNAPSLGMVGGGMAQNSHTATSLKAAKNSELDSAIGDLNGVVGRVGDLVGMLHDRLGTVMREPVPMDSEKDAERGYATSKASAIASNTRQVRQIQQVLESILDRLEV